MKHIIEYEYDPKNPPYYFAVSVIDGQREFTAGNNWDEAKLRHLDKLTRLGSKPTPPPSEEVEI